jgi:hypothetical protein
MGITYFFKIYSQTIKLVDTSYSEKDNETCYDWRYQKSRQAIGVSGDQFPYSAGYGTRWDHEKNMPFFPLATAIISIVKMTI